MLLIEKLKQELDITIYHMADYDEGMHGEGYGYYSSISSTASLDTIKAIIQEARGDGFGRGCSHMHDCCGCAFLANWDVFEQYEGKYIVKEDWGINI